MDGLIRRAAVATGAVVVAAGAGLGVIAAAPAASAATAHPLAGHLAAVSAPSTSMAGYVLASPPASASASDKFKVPTVTCPPTGTYGIGVGVFLFTSLGLTGAEVTAECSSGTAVYTAQWLEHGVSGGAFTVAAGDTIEAQAFQTATQTQAVILDRTKRFGTEWGSFVGAANSGVLVGINALVSSSNTQLPVPPFGSERFNNGTIDGGTVLASGAVAENMRTSTRVLQIHTGVLNSTGTAWTEVFKHS
jgi:hypothetical protein